MVNEPLPCNYYAIIVACCITVAIVSIDNEILVKVVRIFQTARSKADSLSLFCCLPLLIWIKPVHFKLNVCIVRHSLRLTRPISKKKL